QHHVATSTPPPPPPPPSLSPWAGIARARPRSRIAISPGSRGSWGRSAVGLMRPLRSLRRLERLGDLAPLLGREHGTGALERPPRALAPHVERVCDCVQRSDLFRGEPERVSARHDSRDGSDER